MDRTEEYGVTLMDHATIEQRQLIDLYVAGKLSPEDTEAFEEHYLDCEECLDQVEAADRLQRGLRRVAEQEVTKAVKTSFLVALAARASSWQAGLTLTALIATGLLAGVWQHRQVTALRGDLEASRRELAAAQGGDEQRIASLRRELAETRSAFDATQSRWLEELGVEREKAEQLAARLVSALKPQINTRIYSLSSFRDAGVGESPRHQIALPRTGDWIVIALEVSGAADTRYRGTLRRGEEVLWQAGDLEADALGSVVISFPVDHFKAGDYRLDLTASKSGGDGPVTHFPLRINP